MPKTFLLSSCFLLMLLLQGQTHPPSPKKKYAFKETTFSHKLGNTTIEIKTYQYGNAKDLVMVNLHDNETTSVAAAKKVLEAEGGLLIKIENNNQRNITFQLSGRTYQFDPNRIFSKEGIQEALGISKYSNEAVFNEVEKFAKHILRLIPKNPSCIIALHNNANKEEFSVISYLPGNERVLDAKKLHINERQDPDDLFFTTDSLLYFQLVAEKYNRILQDNENAYNDGSLSIYCGENGFRYLNCETQHGKTEKYLTMLTRSVNYIERVNPDAVLYTCKWTLPGKVSIRLADDIYFGEKKVGVVKSVNTDSSGNFYCKIEIKKSFPIYSNSDFFLFQYPSGHSKIDIRIDPTRGKKMIDPNKVVFNVNID